MKKAKHLKKALEVFAKKVIAEARENLTKKNNSGNLSKSLTYKESTGRNWFSLKFLMEDYGRFQDEGVKGSKRTYPESKKSPFSYRDKMPPTQTIASWAKSKNIRLRDKKGRFAKGNYKTIGFLFARSIMEKGLRASMFFTKPFERAFKKLPETLINDFQLEVDEFMEFTYKKEMFKVQDK